MMARTTTTMMVVMMMRKSDEITQRVQTYRHTLNQGILIENTKQNIRMKHKTTCSSNVSQKAHVGIQIDCKTWTRKCKNKESNATHDCSVPDPPDDFQELHLLLDDRPVQNETETLTASVVYRQVLHEQQSPRGHCLE